MLSFRITKYDPAYRDASGVYLRSEWTSRSDIGRSFEGVILTESEYSRVEDAYVQVAIEYLREAGVQALRIDGLEGRAPVEQSIVGVTHVADLLRGMLREEFWCRLESPRGFVHVGYDYCMYIGVSAVGAKAAALSRRLGLFVEEVPSPYVPSSGA